MPTNETPAKKKELLKINLRRDLKDGRIYMRLQGNPETFAPLIDATRRDRGESETYYFQNKPENECFFAKRNEIARLRFNTSSYCYFDDSSYLNGSMILSKNLAGGVEFPVTQGPIDDEAVLEYRNRFKEAVKSLYKSYLRPLNLEVSIAAIEHDSLG